MTRFMRTLTGVAAAASMMAFANAASATAFINPWDTDPHGNITLTFGDGRIGSADAPAEYHSLDFGSGPVLATAADGVGFHDNTGSSPTTFTDTFDFFLPDGWVSFSLTSTGSAASHMNFTGVTFNGVGFPLTNNIPPPGVYSSGAISPFYFYVAEGGPQHLVVTGTGGASASWSGVGSFAPVPEPATWGLMIVGFGGVGALLRSRRRQAVAFA